MKHQIHLINPREHTLNSQELSQSLAPCAVIHRSNGIHFDDFDLSLSFAFEQRGAKVFNSPLSLLLYRDKLQQSILLQSLHLPTIAWAARRSSVNSSFLKISRHYGPPYIYKTQRGSQGIGVHFISHKMKLKELLKKSDQRYILQKFVPSDFELRCFFIGKKKWYLRKEINSKGTFHYESDNFYLATKDEQKIISHLSSKIIKATKYFSGAIDFLIADGCPYFLELNANPGFQSLEKLSKDNIAAIYIESIMKDCLK